MTHLGKTMAIASRYLVVREAPKSSSMKIGSVDAGVELPVTGAAVNGWYPVSFNDVDGYVYGRYVSICDVEPDAEEDEIPATSEEVAENSIQETSSDNDCSPVIGSSYEAYPASGVDIASLNDSHLSADGNLLAARKGDSPKEVADWLMGGYKGPFVDEIAIKKNPSESSEVDEHKEDISTAVEDIRNRVNDQEVKHLEREEKKSTKKKKGLFRAILDFFGW